MEEKEEEEKEEKKEKKEGEEKEEDCAPSSWKCAWAFLYARPCHTEAYSARKTFFFSLSHPLYVFCTSCLCFEANLLFFALIKQSFLAHPSRCFVLVHHYAC